jgi:hypothetical protein
MRARGRAADRTPTPAGSGSCRRHTCRARGATTKGASLCRHPTTLLQSPPEMRCAAGTATSAGAGHWWPLLLVAVATLAALAGALQPPVVPGLDITRANADIAGRARRGDPICGCPASKVTVPASGLGMDGVVLLPESTTESTEYVYVLHRSSFPKGSSGQAAFVAARACWGLRQGPHIADGKVAGKDLGTLEHAGPDKAIWVTPRRGGYSVAGTNLAAGATLGVVPAADGTAKKDRWLALRAAGAELAALGVLRQLDKVQPVRVLTVDGHAAIATAVATACTGAADEVACRRGKWRMLDGGWTGPSLALLSSSERRTTRVSAVGVDVAEDEEVEEDEEETNDAKTQLQMCIAWMRRATGAAAIAPSSFSRLGTAYITACNQRVDCPMPEIAPPAVQGPPTKGGQPPAPVVKTDFEQRLEKATLGWSYKHVSQGIAAVIPKGQGSDESQWTSRTRRLRAAVRWRLIGVVCGEQHQREVIKCAMDLLSHSDGGGASGGVTVQVGGPAYEQWCEEFAAWSTLDLKVAANVGDGLWAQAAHDWAARCHAMTDPGQQELCFVIGCGGGRRAPRNAELPRGYFLFESAAKQEARILKHFSFEGLTLLKSSGTTDWLGRPVSGAGFDVDAVTGEGLHSFVSMIDAVHPDTGLPILRARWWNTAFAVEMREAPRSMIRLSVAESRRGVTSINDVMNRLR